MSNWESLPFSLEDYWEWKAKLEAGYGQDRPGVTATQVRREIAQIPKAIRRTYLAQKWLAKGRG